MRTIHAFLFTCIFTLSACATDTKSLYGPYILDETQPNKSLIAGFAFLGEKTVIVVNMFGMKLSGSYTIDKDYVQITTYDGALTLKIENSDKLIGYGYADGVFIKSETNKTNTNNTNK